MEGVPVVIGDVEGWKVAIIKYGSVQTYLCATEELALKFAAMLSQPLVEKRVRNTPRLSARRRLGWTDRLRMAAGL